MKRLLSKYIPKENIFLTILTEYEIFNTNCDHQHAKEKAERFLQFKKQGLPVPPKECV